VKALRTHGFDSLECIRLDEIPMPQPATGELRVRLRACAVSFVDLLVAEGKYQLRPPLPFVPGSEFAGVVDAIGDGYRGPLREGDRVCGSRFLGIWAEFATVPAGVVRRIDESVPFEHASALMMPYGTALYALRERGQLRSGETVLVLGAAGSVGYAAVQVARALGAHVIAATTSAAKRPALLEAGAHQVVDVADPQWKDAVKAMTGAGGVDVVVDPLGGDYTDPAFRTLGWRGRHLVVGFAGGAIPALRSNLALLKGASLVGVDLRQFAEREPDSHAALLGDVVAMHGRGDLRPAIARAMPLERFREAFALVRDRSTVGRVVLTI
jgi:NADPH2:quinone reductase